MQEKEWIVMGGTAKAMEPTAKFESEVLALLRQLNAKKEKLQTEYTQELANIDKQIEAVQTTAMLMRESGEGSHVIITRPNIVVPGNLRNLSVRAACVEIARQNGGVLKVGEASQALLSAGVIQKRKHAWGATYTACARSKDFEKDEAIPGTFRLVSQNPDMPLQLGHFRAM